MVVATLHRNSDRLIRVEIHHELFQSVAASVKTFVNDSQITGASDVMVECAPLSSVGVAEFVFEFDTTRSDLDWSTSIGEMMSKCECDVLNVRDTTSHDTVSSAEVVPTAYSHSRTIESICSVLTSQILRMCWNYDEIKSGALSLSLSQKRQLKSPRNLSVEKLKKKVRGLLLHEQWRIGFSEQNATERYAINDKSVQWLSVPDDGTFTADPFIVELNGEAWIIYEHLGKNNVGVIKAIKASDIQLSHAKTLLSTGSHLSYPFIYPHGDTIYVIPESSSIKTTTVYRLDPNSVELQPQFEILRGVGLVDPTIFEHEGRLWLFASIAGIDENGTLFAWHSTSLNGSWMPHKQNPIKTSSKSARPAGTPYLVDGKLFRPSQDVIKRYGAAVTLNRIELLTPEEFREVEVETIEPQQSWPNRAGFHHIGRHGKWFVIDALRDHVSLHQIKHTIGI